jgi:Domain of unknown function (DUF6378)
MPEYDKTNIETSKTEKPWFDPKAKSLDDLNADPADLLEQAAATFRARAKQYGDYRVNMAVFAGLASQRLGYTVTASQAAGLMSDLKQSRLLHDPAHHDSAKDKIVYETMRTALVMED